MFDRIYQEAKARKSRLKVVGISLIASLLFWIVDAVVDTVFHYNDSFVSLLFFNDRETAFHLLVTLCFVLFGIYMAGIVERKEIIEHQLRRETGHRAQASDALEDSFSRQKALLNTIPDMAWLKDEESRYLMVNAPFGHRCGMEPGDLVGKTDFDIWPKDLAELYRADDRKVMQSGTRRHVDEPLVGKDGSWSWVETIKTPVFSEKGDVIGTSGISRDVTARKRAMAELDRYRRQLEELVGLHTAELTAANEELQNEIAGHRRAELNLTEALAELSGIMEAVPDMLFVLDTERRLVRWNHAMERTTGHDGAGLKDRDALDFIAPDDRPAIEDGIRETFERGYAVREAHVITRQAEALPVLFSAAPLKDGDGRVQGLVGIGRDIAGRKKMEEELARAEKLESLAILAGGIAHDFNNLLTAVLGNISVALVKQGVGRELRLILQEAERAAFRAKDLTQQLQTFSKAGEPSRKTVSIVSPVRESVDFALRGSNVTCAFLIADDLRHVEVDEGQISQVFHNLAINAKQAMRSGGTITMTILNVRIDSDSPHRLPPGDYVRVDIADEGAGIPPDVIPKIFDPYFTTKPDGSGLGLATAHSIIARHGGAITVDSTLGSGASFSVFLPASSIVPSEGEQQTQHLVRGKGKILVMEDEEIIRLIIGKMLAELGYRASFTENGESALVRYRQAAREGRPYDAVIMDLTVRGGMGGAECVKELLSLDPRAKVIVSSGYPEEPAMAHYRSYGFRGVIEKPYRIEDLSVELYRVMNDIPR